MGILHSFAIYGRLAHDCWQVKGDKTVRTQCRGRVGCYKNAEGMLYKKVTLLQYATVIKINKK